MPAFGKAKSHNWVEADNAFGDFDAIKVFKILNTISAPEYLKIMLHYITG